MDSKDIAKDIDDLNELQGDLVALIRAVTMLELKYKETPAGAFFSTGCRSLKSAAVDFLSAADHMEILASDE